MEGLEVKNFEAKDVFKMDLRSIEANGLAKSEHYIDRLISLDEKSDGAVTLIYNGRVLCCAGFWTLWKGVGECWVLPSKNIYKAPRAYTQTIKNYLDSVVKTFNYHRIQSTSVADETHAKWMGFLGFELEGVMKNYTYDKQDYYLWGRTA